VSAHGLLTAGTRRIREFHASCLSFLVNFVDWRPDLFDDDLVKSVLGLMLQFSGCSLFHVEVIRFVRASLGVSVVRQRILRHFGHVMLVETQFREHGVIPIAAFAVHEDLWRASQRNADLRGELLAIDGYSEFIDGKLIPYVALRDEAYGGDVHTSFLDVLLSGRLIF